VGRGAESSRGDKDAIVSSSLFAVTCAQAAPNPITQHRRNPPFPLTVHPATRASHVTKFIITSIIVVPTIRPFAQQQPLYTSHQHCVPTKVCCLMMMIESIKAKGPTNAHHQTHHHQTNMTWTCQNYGCQTQTFGLSILSQTGNLLPLLYISRISSCDLQNSKYI
jgi:hypothetical protein